MIKNFLNLKGHQNTISVSEVTTILLKGWIWPIGGVSSGRVCTFSLHRRLLFVASTNYIEKCFLFSQIFKKGKHEKVVFSRVVISEAEYAINILHKTKYES